MDEESKTDEVNRLEDIFVANGYPWKLTQAALHVKPPLTQSEDPNTNKKNLVLPYVKGLSEKITQTCRKLNIQTAFMSRSTLRSILTHVKK